MPMEYKYKALENEPESLLKEFFDLLPNYSEEDKKTIEKAWKLLVEKTKDVKRPAERLITFILYG